MWQSHLEIEHYSVSVKNELTVLIKALGLPPPRAQVSALFVPYTSSYTHESAFTLGYYVEYTRDTHVVKFGKFQRSVSLGV